MTIIIIINIININKYNIIITNINNNIHHNINIIDNNINDNININIKKLLK